MDTIKSARGVLRTAEETLRSLVAEAADSGDYDAVVTVTGWARAVAAIDSGDVQSLPKMASAIVRVNRTDPPKAKPPKPTTSRRKPKINDYPAFFVDGDALVKVAWSKSAQAEYEHKAPRYVALEFAKSFAMAANGNGIVAMDQILPLHGDDGQEVPAYQSYLILGWLKKMGLVRQHGRKGYSLRPDSNLEKDTAAALATLQPRKPS